MSATVPAHVTISINLNGVMVNMVTFFVNERGQLDVQLNPGVQTTDAMRLFIAFMREQIQLQEMAQKLATAPVEGAGKAN